MIAGKEDNPARVKQKKTKSITEDVVGCFGPVLFLERLLGIFRFKVSEGNLMPTSHWMKLLGLLITIAIATVFLYSFDMPSKFSGEIPLINVMAAFPSVVILIQYVTSAAMTSCLLSQANIRIMTSLANIDSTLHINTDEEFYRKSRNYSIRVLALILIIHLITSACDFFMEITDDNTTLSDILDYTLNSVQDIEILIFFLMLNMLKCRLKVINNYLVKNIHHDDIKDKISVYTIRQRNAKTENKFDLHGNIPVTNLRELSLAYDVIGEACHLVNNVYNFQIFMTLISAFVYIVITLWTTLYYFRTEVYIGNLVSIILWCCSEMLTVAAMAFVCEKLLSARSETKVLVNELVMDYGLPSRTRAQAKAFMELIEAWPLRIYVYDMFTVDITLMLKFISVSTTYLIVIIQISHFV